MPNPKEKQVVVLKKLFCYIRNYTPLVILSLLFAAASAALALYVPILTGRAIDCILGPRNVDFAGIFHILFQMGLVVLVTAAAQWLLNICNNRITYQVVRDLRVDAFEKIEILPLKYLDAHSQPCYFRRGSGGGRPVNGVYAIVYRGDYHYRHAAFYGKHPV